MNHSPEIIRQHNLTGEEYDRIVKTLGREPNLVELGVFSVMWSEHCSYKSSRRFLKQFPTSGKRVLQGPGENAGVVDIGDGLALAFKMESHNHPSFIEPYQGAATGVGGILRDVFTMGARPIANLNSLRFGAVDHPKTAHLVEGVVAGIAGYGNCMGIPTVGGEVFFDPSYNGNILVNAMTVGLIEKDKIFKGLAAGVGNPVMYVGSKTGRDGIHGATMASDVFDDSAEQKRPTVQVGDPFTEKKLLEACLELMTKDVIVGIQDMGAAGLTSSSVEMASRAGTGIELHLDKVPLREEGMTPYEILLSESQERMLLVAKKGTEKIVTETFAKWDLDACVIGTVVADRHLTVHFGGAVVARLPVAPLTDGAPVYERPRQESKEAASARRENPSSLPVPSDLNFVFKKMISHPTLASKKWVYRQYDHQVMTNTVILPGSDAAVLRLKGTKRGIAVTTNGNSRYCFLDPKVGGMIAIAESGRNLVCSGAVPLAVTDCLNFGNPERPDIMGQFEKAISGMAEACRFFDTPVVSGNVSFYNETNGISIFPTPVIGMVGLLEDIERRCDQYFRKEGDLIFLLGENRDELGGSEYLAVIHGKTIGAPPKIDLAVEKSLWDSLLALIAGSLIHSAHDLSEGGFALALAESCFGLNLLGAQVELDDNLRPDVLLFGESQSRVLLSADGAAAAKIEEIAKKNGVSCRRIGTVGGSRITIRHKGKSLIDLPVTETYALWSAGFEKGVFGSCAA